MVYKLVMTIKSLRIKFSHLKEIWSASLEKNEILTNFLLKSDLWVLGQELCSEDQYLLRHRTFFPNKWEKHLLDSNRINFLSLQWTQNVSILCFLYLIRSEGNSMDIKRVLIIVIITSFTSLFTCHWTGC